MVNNVPFETAKRAHFKCFCAGPAAAPAPCEPPLGWGMPTLPPRRPLQPRRPRAAVGLRRRAKEVNRSWHV